MFIWGETLTFLQNVRFYGCYFNTIGRVYEYRQYTVYRYTNEVYEFTPRAPNYVSPRRISPGTAMDRRADYSRGSGSRIFYVAREHNNNEKIKIKIKNTRLSTLIRFYSFSDKRFGT